MKLKSAVQMKPFWLAKMHKSVEGLFPRPYCWGLRRFVPLALSFYRQDELYLEFFAVCFLGCY